jgi:ubiquinone/menaquinone biosynthesis C-methylase UbiE
MSARRRLLSILEALVLWRKRPELRTKAFWTGVMNKVQVVSPSEKFDLVAPVFDESPGKYSMLWDEKVFMDILGDVAGKTVLDVGCGTGRLMWRLEELGAETMGIDVSGRMIEEAKAKSLLAVQADITRFEWNESFDIITLVQTMEYIGDKGKALENTWYLLKLGGRLIMLSSLAREDTLVSHGDDLIASEYYPMSRDDCWRLLVQIGYDVVRTVDLTKTDSSKSILESDEPIGFIIEARKTHELAEEECRA